MRERNRQQRGWNAHSEHTNIKRRRQSSFRVAGGEGWSE